MNKKLTEYKILLSHELISKLWWLLEGEIITQEEFIELAQKIENRWGETKTLEIFPHYYS